MSTFLRVRRFVPVLRVHVFLYVYYYFGRSTWSGSMASLVYDALHSFVPVTARLAAGFVVERELVSQILLLVS